MPNFTFTQAVKPALLALTLAMTALPAAADDGEDKLVQPAIIFTSCDKPVWPEESFKNGNEGTVTLEFTVDPSGQPTAARVVKSSGFVPLDDAARDGLMKCTFQPGTKNGQPLISTARIQYVWTLN